MRSLKTTCTLLLLIGACSALPQHPWQQRTQCAFHQGCVPDNQCVNGFISTDGGVGRIIIRSGSERICTNLVNPGVPSICCNKREVMQDHPPCPTNQRCVPDNQCVNGVISTDGGVGRIIIRSGSERLCYVDQTTKKEGICCTPPGSTTTPHTTTPTYPVASKCGVRNSKIVPGKPAIAFLSIGDVRSQSSASHNEAKFGEFPWQGMILKNDAFDTFVGGASLIGQRWVVTAAHKVHGSKPRNIKVRLGEWQLESFDEPKPFFDVDVAAITIHPDFVLDNLHNNIAVLKLVVPLASQYHINSICLPSPGQTFWGQRCIATGWGKDTFDGRYQRIMKQIELPTVEHHQCQRDLRKALSNEWFVLDDSFMCAGGEENKDACNGDGGGPLACLDPRSGRYVLAGITAFGVDGCGIKDVPGVYADVQALLPFVNDVFNFYNSGGDRG